MPMTDDPLAHHRTLAFGQSLRILGDRHSGFAHDHKEDATLVHPPQIVSVQIPAINHDRANLRMLSQVALGLLQQRDEPTPLVILDFDQFHGQREACLNLNEDQYFPPIDVIFLRRRFFLSFDFDAAGLLELSTALIALGGRQFASIQCHQEGASKEALMGEQLHHLVEEPLNLFLGEFADVVRQALGAEWSLLLFRGALPISAFGQPVCALLSVEPDQFHQRQVAKEDARKLMHRLTPKEHFEQIQQHKLHRWHQHPLDSRWTHQLKRLQHADFSQVHEKFIEQPCIAELMHLLNGFSCI